MEVHSTRYFAFFKTIDVKKDKAKPRNDFSLNKTKKDMKYISSRRFF